MPRLSSDQLKVVKALYYTDWDWRTVSGIAADASMDRLDVRAALNQLMKRGIVIKSDETDWDNNALYSVPKGFSISEYMSRVANSKPRGAGTKHRVFVVHGRDSSARAKVSAFIESLGLEAVILDQQAFRFEAILDRFESYAKSVSYAIAILTPDDVGAMQGDVIGRTSKGSLVKELRGRARQNVIFELGYFIGKLTRNKVCALVDGDVEIPSDLNGILYVSLSVRNWRATVLNALRTTNIVK